METEKWYMEIRVNKRGGHWAKQFKGGAAIGVGRRFRHERMHNNKARDGSYNLPMPEQREARRRTKSWGLGERGTLMRAGGVLVVARVAGVVVRVWSRKKPWTIGNKNRRFCLLQKTEWKSSIAAQLPCFHLGTQKIIVLHSWDGTSPNYRWSNLKKKVEEK